jgi:hypothetical protein
MKFNLEDDGRRQGLCVRSSTYICVECMSTVTKQTPDGHGVELKV